jgi:hypothetical protein
VPLAHLLLVESKPDSALRDREVFGAGISQLRPQTNGERLGRRIFAPTMLRTMWRVAPPVRWRDYQSRKLRNIRFVRVVCIAACRLLRGRRQQQNGGKDDHAQGKNAETKSIGIGKFFLEYTHQQRANY